MTRVSAKHQITLPAAAMKAANIHVGDGLVIRAEGDGRLVLQRVDDRSARWAGAVPGLSAATNLEELRDEWEW